jgi:Ca-activated chloride channel family protein
LDLKASWFDIFDIVDAKEAYEREDFKSATNLFRKVALSSGLDSARYDLGCSLYKEGRFKEALREFKSIVTKDRDLEFKKSFNIGNSYFKLGEFQKAIKAYEEALKIRDDKDARYNLKLAKKMLKKTKESKNDKKSDKSDEKNKKERQKSRQNGSQNRNNSQKKSSKRESLSNRELKRWREHLQRVGSKTKPMKIDSKRVKRREYVKPW